MIYVLKQFLKFVVVGLIAFGIDYGLLVFFTEICGINYLLSATISFIISVIFNYIASMRYIYIRKDTLSKRKEFLIFVVLAIVGLIINNILLYIGVEILKWDYRIMKIVAGVIVALWNFISRKIWLDASKTEAITSSQKDVTPTDKNT